MYVHQFLYFSWSDKLTEIPNNRSVFSRILKVRLRPECEKLSGANVKRVETS